LPAVEPSMATVSKRLARCYGRPRQVSGEPLVDVLIRTILSQNTTDTNSLKAYAELRKRYSRWASLAAASQPEVARAIRTGGLSKIKSKRIIALVRSLVKDRGNASLEYLRRMPAEQAYQHLLSIKGVGPKTAACTLLFGAGIPVFPVDTHIYRVSGRLGWARSDEDREKYQERIRHQIPDRLVSPLHLNLIEHGRTVCHPHRPHCRQCCLRTICPKRRIEE
jgi:endonuclease-3